MGEFLTIWTVRLAVGCYVGRYAVDVARSEGNRQPLSRVLWTSGCALYVIHVVCAFAFFHDWSHHRAYEQTAAQTNEVVGWNWGGGLYFNYFFTALWIADVVSVWFRPRRRTRSQPILSITVQLFLAFLVFTIKNNESCFQIS